MFHTTSNRPNTGSLAEYASTLTIHGAKIPKPITAALDAQAAALANIRAVRSVAFDAAALSRQASEALAAGKGDAVQILTAALARMATADGAVSPVQSIFNTAELQVNAKLTAAFKEYGERWATEVMHPLVAAAVETIKAADNGVLQFDILNRHQSRAAEPLLTLPQVATAYGVISGVWDVAEHFRHFGILGLAAEMRRDHYEWNGPERQREQVPNNFTGLVHLLRLGQTPGVYSAADLEAHHTINNNINELETISE